MDFKEILESVEGKAAIRAIESMTEEQRLLLAVACFKHARKLGGALLWAAAMQTENDDGKAI